MFSTILNLFKKKSNKYIPVKGFSIISIKQLCKSIAIFAAEVIVSKRYYYIYKDNDYIDVIANECIKNTKWYTNCNNSEDFAFAIHDKIQKKLEKAAFGVALVEYPEGNHPAYKAYNFFIDDKEQFNLIEFHNNRVFTKPDAWRIYFILI